ncbi:MAG: AraC family transcriptional regulator [Peptococcaceae bacterium]|jgi:two-component system response regulator YesN|nr:AraC family transcriptional regulator [Peptococcaceae bacterium]
MSIVYRAIIADDEEKARNLILTLGKWEALGIEVVDQCADGEEAWDSIMRLRPDIAITDIRMPAHDGLELARLAGEAGIETRFIIISGYRHFEYAYTALKYSVTDYLLKPIDEDNLNAALGKIIASLRDAQAQRRESADYARLLEKKVERARGELLEALGAGTWQNDDLASFNAEYGASFDTGVYRALLLNTSQSMLHGESFPFGRQLEDILRTVFIGWCRHFVIPDPRGFFIFVNYSPPNADRLGKALSALIGKTRALGDIYGSFSVAVGVGDPVPSLARLPESFAAALLHEAAKQALGWDKAVFALPTTLAKPEAPPLTAQMLRELDGALDTLDGGRVDEWFARWAENDLAGMPGARALWEAREALAERLAVLGAPEPSRRELAIEAGRALDIGKMREALHEAYSRTLRERLEERNQAEGRPIRLAKQYIQRHYASPLTLEDVAGHVGFSPAYFSTLFKKGAGQSFGDYLIQTRLSQAKTLLKETDRAVDEIAGQVGYMDSKYFRKLFKKTTGMKPSEYRKLYW